jgi:hypothetical protein
MTINLTNYYVEVAGQNTDGELRVYRQSIDVLYLPNTDLIGTANNTLNFVQTGLGANGINKSLVDTLNFIDWPTRVIYASANNTLTLVHSPSKAIPVSANNTLNIADTEFEFNYVDDRKIPYNTLNLVQTVQTLSGIAISDTLNFQQSVTVTTTIIYVSVSDWLHLFHHTPTTHRHWFTDDLALYVSRATIPKIHSLAQALVFLQLGRLTSLKQALVFVQTAEASFGYTLISYLELDDQQARLVDYIRHQYDSLGIGHSLGWYTDSPCNRKQYTPFQGENTIPGALTPLPSTLPLVQVSPMTDRMLLYYPSTGPRTSNVTLRAPEMDNRDRNAYTRVSRETMGGKLVVYADPTWPRVRTMVVTIIGLQKTAVDAFQVFKQATLGKEIGITDWEGRMWAGVITNPDEAVTQDGPTSWTVTFECECELLVGQHPDSGGLAITDSVSYVIV